MREFITLEDAKGLKIEDVKYGAGGDGQLILFLEGGKYSNLVACSGYEGYSDIENTPCSEGPYWLLEYGIITQEEYDAIEAEKKAKKEQAQAEADLAHTKAVKENTKIFKAVGFFPEGTSNRVKNEVLDNLGTFKEA